MRAPGRAIRSHQPVAHIQQEQHQRPGTRAARAPGQRPGMAQITFSVAPPDLWALRRRLAPTARKIPGQQDQGLR